MEEEEEMAMYCFGEVNLDCGIYDELPIFLKVGDTFKYEKAMWEVVAVVEEYYIYCKPLEL